MSENINLLLVDDEVTLGEIIKESLETRDFQVNYCKDGEEAWVCLLYTSDAADE